MENTEELDIDVEDIGAILKSNRLKQKKTMEEISSELCIRKIYLTALEEGDYVTLPPVPYGVGYVRTYARYLGLNAERAVKLYKSAAETDNAEKEEVLTAPEANKSNSLHIILGVIAILAVYGAWKLYSASVTTAPLEVQEELVDEPVGVEETQAEVTEETSNAKEKTAESAAEEGEAFVAEEQSVEAVSVGVDAAMEEKVETTEVVAKPEVVNNKVLLEFKGESWVELKDKNKVYFQGVFHKGDKKEINYVDNLFLSVGRPGNVTVYIKGAKKDILVKRKKMNIPLDSLD